MRDGRAAMLIYGLRGLPDFGTAPSGTSNPGPGVDAVESDSHDAFSAIRKNRVKKGKGKAWGLGWVWPKGA
jgi:hypothetical protein